MDATFLDIVLDDDVDCVRFHSADYVSVFYKDGSRIGIEMKNGKWRVLSDNPPSLVE